MLTDEQRLLRAVSERAWQAQVEQTLALCGFELRYHTHDSRRSRRGFPDLVAIRREPDGVTLFVGELKRENGRITADQSAWLMGWLWMQAGLIHHPGPGLRMIVGVFRPSDAERLWELLREER